MKLVISSIFTGIMIALIFLSAGYLFLYSGYRIFVITSGSMLPALKPGSLIITKVQSIYSLGQVVAFYHSAVISSHSLKPNPSTNSKPIIITHRIIASTVKNGQLIYQTKGDANAQVDDQEILATQVLGKVWLVFPDLGFVVSWIYQRLNLVILFFLPVGLIIIVKLIIFLT